MENQVDPKYAPEGYKAVLVTRHCHGCAFEEGTRCPAIPCTPSGRPDGQSVIFVRLASAGRFELTLDAPDPRIVDTRRNNVVVVSMSAEYAQLVCLERVEAPGLTGLCEWLNSLSASDLASENIPEAMT